MGTIGVVEREAARGAAQRGSNYGEVWRTMLADPYGELPRSRVSLRSLPKLLRGSLFRAAKRTLDVSDDLLPTFDKLVHPYGICLTGTWRIDRPSPYDGYFAQGSEALIIARASDAVGETRPGKLRFLGLAGKLYPTRDPRDTRELPTANFFCLENLSGSHTGQFAHAAMTNDLINVFPHPGAMRLAPLGGLAGVLFAWADDTLDLSRPAIRQLYPIAELGTVRRPARCPRFMRLVGHEANARVSTPDLREELAKENHPDGIRFHVEVADGRLRVGPKNWQRIGSIHFYDSVASYSGDHRLHFSHPRYRS